MEKNATKLSKCVEIHVFFEKNEKKNEKIDVPQNVSCLNSTFLLIKLVKNHTTAMIMLDQLIFF